MESQSFFEIIKTTRKLLKEEKGNGNLLSGCMEFVKESVGFLNKINASATQNNTACSVRDDTTLTEWYPVLVKALVSLHGRRKEKGFNLEMVLSYLNHILIHLVRVNGVPVDWFQCLGLINLEFLSAYIQLPSHKSDFLSALVQKSHQCMRIFAQRAEKESKTCSNNQTNVGDYFKLLIISSTYLTLDTTSCSEQQQQDPLPSCKGFVSNFLQLFSLSGEKSGFVNKAAAEVAKDIFRLCCLFYCLRGADVFPQSEKDACFFKELFRLVQHFPPFRDKFVSCHGNLSSFVTDMDGLDGFSLDETSQVMTNNVDNFKNTLVESKAFKFMTSIARIVHALILKAERQSILSKDLETTLKADLEASTNFLHSIFSSHPSPGSRLPQYVGEIISLLTNPLLISGDGFKTVSIATTGSALHHLLSLSLDALIRDVLCYCGGSTSSATTELSSSVAAMVSRRAYDMAVVSKARMALLQSLLFENNLDNSVQVSVSGRLKCSLNLLCILVQKVKKGCGLSPESSAYRTVFKTLKNAVTSVGALCRHLRRSEKYEVIIAVFGPLWPVASLPEMLAHVSHHESLCDAYRVQGDVQAACQVVMQASTLGGTLVTHALLKSVLKIAKTETTLKLPVLFSRCPDDGGVKPLMGLVRLMYTSQSSSHSLNKHLQSVLRHMVDSVGANSSMSLSDKVLAKLMLAENGWYHNSSSSSSDAVTATVLSDGKIGLETNNSTPLGLLQECITEADVTCQDLKAQAVLLAAEIHHAMICLKMDQPSASGEMSVDSSTTSKTNDVNGNKNSLAVTSDDEDDDYAAAASTETPEGSNSNNSIASRPPTALEAHVSVKSGLSSSSVYDTPVTHSTKYSGKFQHWGMKRRNGNKNQQPSTSSLFSVWEYSIADDSTVGNDNKNDDDDDDEFGIAMEVDSRELMEAVKKSLEMWKEWYEKMGEAEEEEVVESNVRQKGINAGGGGGNSDDLDVAFRVDRSLAFLQHMVSLALAHDKPLLALDSLYQARELASKTKRLSLEKEIYCMLLSLWSRLGLFLPESDCKTEGERRSHSAEKGEKGLVQDGLVDVVEMMQKAEQGEQGEPSCLVAMANYLFSTHKVRDSVRVQKSVVIQIEKAREKDLLTPSLTLQLAQLKCLMVECSRLVELQGLYQQEDLTGQHPLQVVCEALKYITSLKSFLMGKTGHVLAGKGSSVDSWRVIGDYLSTLYLGGRVFLQAGMVKSCRTYWMEGLKMARSCRLATWCVFFTTVLADLNVTYLDSMSGASKYLKTLSCQETEADPRPAISPLSLLKPVGCSDDLSTFDTALLSLSSVNKKAVESQSVLWGEEEEEEDSSDWSTLNRLDFSPRRSMFYVYRMWLEAEIALHPPDYCPDFSKAIEHLLHAETYVSHLTHQHQGMLHACREQFPTLIPQQRNDDKPNSRLEVSAELKLLAAETLLRLAQTFFYLLSEKCKQCQQHQNSCRDGDGRISSCTKSDGTATWNGKDINRFKSELSNLLETVVIQGKKLSYCYEGKVIVATAQLLKIHLALLLTTTQRSMCVNSGEGVGCVENKGGGEKIGEEEDDGRDVWMDCDYDDDDDNGDNVDEAAYIAEEVKELKLEEDFWNEKRKQRMVGEAAFTKKSVDSSNSSLKSSKISRTGNNRTNGMTNDLSPSQLHNINPITTSPPSKAQSPTKRSSPPMSSSSSTLTGKENVIPPTPPKISKDSRSSKSCVKMKGMVASTPASFSFSPASASYTAAKNRRGVGRKTVSKTSKALQFGEDERKLEKRENEEEIIEDDSESSANVNLFEGGVNSSVMKGKSKPKTAAVRGRRGRGKVLQSTADTDVKDQDSDQLRTLTDEHLISSNMVVSQANSLTKLELSPLTDQLGKLSICKKSVSPTKRKSASDFEKSAISEINNIEDDGGHEEVVNEVLGSGSSCGKQQKVDEVKDKQSRRGRGKTTTSSKSSAISRKKTKITKAESCGDYIKIDTAKIVNEIPEHSAESGSTKVSVPVADSASPKQKGRRKTKTTVPTSSKPLETKSSVAVSRRRQTRRKQVAEDQEVFDGDEDCSPEVQRGTNVYHGEQSPDMPLFDSFSSNPLHITSTNSNVSEDRFDITSSSANFKEFDSPIYESTLSSPSLLSTPLSLSNIVSGYRLDNFSTPLRELHLNSPMEVPRGRPQRSKTTAGIPEKSNQAAEKDGTTKRASRAARVVVSSQSPDSTATEIPRGLDDDHDDDNNGNQKTGLSRRKATKGKLSLKKTTKKAAKISVPVLCENNDTNTNTDCGFIGGKILDKNDCKELESEFKDVKRVEKENRKPVKSEILESGNENLKTGKSCIRVGKSKGKKESGAKRHVRGEEDEEDDEEEEAAAQEGQQNECVFGEGKVEERRRGGLNAVVKTTGKTSKTITAPVCMKECLQSQSEQCSPLDTVSSYSVIEEDGLLEDAMESLQQLSAFPPSYVFNRLSKATAMVLIHRSSTNSNKASPSGTAVAAHLTNSMQVTFQHMLSKNLISKLRVKKSTDQHGCSTNTDNTSTSTPYSEQETEEMDRERTVMKQVLDDSLLSWPLEKTLMDNLRNIPKDWVVLQMTVVHLDLFQRQQQQHLHRGWVPCQVLITRMSSDRPPLTFRIPLDRWKHFASAKRVLESAIVHEVENMTPEKYWTYRYKNDQDMKNLLYFLQEKFLSGHKWLLSGRYTGLTSNKPAMAVLHQSAVNLAKELKLQGGNDDSDQMMDVASLEAILELLLPANEKDIRLLLISILCSPNGSNSYNNSNHDNKSKRVVDLVVTAVSNLQKELGGSMHFDNIGKEKEEEMVAKKGPVVLILDKEFSQVPWESMPFLKSDHMTRVPSHAALQALLRLHGNRSDSVFRNGVGRKNVITVIDPETNLQNSVKLLQPQFEKYKGWTCQTQQALTLTALKQYLTQELYIYSGHGWGRQFVAGDELQMLRAKAVAIIMGCNSGRLESGHLMDGQGPPLYFLLAGCPAVVGNLWVVTDKDIDKLTSDLVHAWMTSKGHRSLGHLLNGARQVCKLVGLNGFAPVIYGLPIQMN